MSVLLKSLVLGTVLCTSSLTAFAQTTETPAIPQTSAEQAGEAVPETSAEQAGEAVEQRAPMPIEGQIVLQNNGTVLANDLIGSNVHNPENEVVGDINDLIVNISGAVEGVVIGVGGFLGIGEKNVAVDMSTITLVTHDNGDIRLVLNASREALEAAESFKSSAAQVTEKRLDQLAAQQQQQQSDLGIKPLGPAN